MCGICGFVNYLDRDFSKDINVMMNSIDHRGPDDFGSFICDNTKLNLGHRRLSIIDLSENGSQPMVSSDKSLVIVFNGEIYNHNELKNKFFSNSKNWRGTSDTEILLECILLLGLEKTLENLVGMFAFAVFDKNNKNIFLVRDRFGEKPCYFSFNDKFLYFASELKALKKISCIDKSIDTSSLKHQLNFGYIEKNKSIYKNISNLDPGTYLQFKLKNNSVELVKKIKYWDTLNEIRNSLSSKYNNKNQALDEIKKQFEKTISSQLVSDVEVGTFFSGGIDSSLVTAFASKIKKNKLKSFSISFDDQQYDESYFAKKIAKSLNINLILTNMDEKKIIEIVPKMKDIFDEPFSDSSQLPTYFLSQLVSDHGLKVVLTGDGGDEIFGGYNRYFLMKRLQILKFIPYNFRNFISEILLKIPTNLWNYMDTIIRNSFIINKKIPNFSHKVAKFLNILKFKSEEDIFEKILETLSLTDILKKEYLKDNIHLKKIESFQNIEDYMMYFDTVNYLPGDILVKVDRSTMSNGLEARSPFLDHNLFCKAWRLPTDYKLNKSSRKIILKEILSKEIDFKLLERPKMGFGIPLNDILRNELREWSINNIESGSLEKIDLIDPKKLKKLKNNFFKKNIGSYIPIWNILILSDWLKNNA